MFLGSEIIVERLKQEGISLQLNRSLKMLVKMGEGQLVSTDFQTEGRHLIWAWSFSWSFVSHLRGRGSSDGLGDG